MRLRFRILRLSVEMIFIRKANIYVHTASGKRYRIKGHVVSKDAITGKWHTSIAYIGQKDGVEYVRSVDSFNESFIKLSKYEQQGGSNNKNT